MTFVEFLEKLDLSEQQYIKAIRLSLKHSTLLLKRSPAEIRINCYNPHLLKAWQASMDIQFVLDPYACAVYILTYITKDQRGMSNLLRKACEEAKEGNKNIVNKVRHIGNKFLRDRSLFMPGVGAEEKQKIVQIFFTQPRHGKTFFLPNPYFIFPKNHKKVLLRKSLNCQHRHKKFQTRFQFSLSHVNFR